MEKFNKESQYAKQGFIIYGIDEIYKPTKGWKRFFFQPVTTNEIYRMLEDLMGAGYTHVNLILKRFSIQDGDETFFLDIPETKYPDFVISEII